ncbi:4Fe-4S binding protein [Chitinophagales bacterium]|nr:4Fe-4S binding protein [Chitinophagales bacterium]
MRKLGMLLFLLALFAYIAALFLNQYELREETLNDLFTEEQVAFLKKDSELPIGKTFQYKQGLLSAFNASIDRANAGITKKYGLEEAQLNVLEKLAKKNGAYNEETLQAVFSKSTAVSDFQKQSLKDYTSWLFGENATENENFRKNLNNAAEGINNSIAYKKGIDNQKSYLFGLIPASNKELNFKLIRESGIGVLNSSWPWYFLLVFVLGLFGALMHILPKRKEPEGIKNNNIFFDSLNSRGAIGIILGTALIFFYCILYWFPAYIAEWTQMLDPLAQLMSGGNAGQWFLYGFLYTLAILVMGVRFLIKYRHNKYQQVRTFSIMFFQVSFAFIISNLLLKFNLPYMDFKNFWPLDYSFFFDYRINEMINAGTFGWFMLFWGIIGFLVLVPTLTYFFGKRWYCSWVCGCGGLAETVGDPFRQQSDKSITAWKFERYIIHGVMVFAFFMTALVIYTYFTGEYTVFGMNSSSVRESYAFLIGAGFSGVIGTGFYPLMGNRVWCRFGCPLAAYMGLVQRFKSRFRITTNGAQCISCGNCSTYCEMGIDVRHYAQRGQDIVRSSCVGCGICAAVCPRGVLKLENGPDDSRNIFEITDGGIKVNV